MATNGEPLPADNYLLSPGYIYLPDRPAAISTVVGSGVAVCIHDGKRKVGAASHFQFPLTRDPRRATARYGNVALPTLVRMLLDRGSRAKHLKAQIFGGARNGAEAGRDIGSENVRMAETVLSRRRIPVISKDVGGRVGRKIVFRTDTNEIMVIKVEKLRAGDWFPYESNR